MKFSEKWLREWVDPPVGTDELVSQLTTAGLEVDSAESVSGETSGVVVARVLEAHPHPDADRLKICLVEWGPEISAEVVCGAPNAREGLCAPYAPPGAKVANGETIRASTIRGVPSNGMLCSPIELGLGEDGDGLLELSADATPGTALEEYLDLDDVSIDIDLTPNRGDCLGLIGVAREVGVINRCQVKPPDVAPVPAQIPDVLPVELIAPAECPRYVGRVVRDVDVKASTPAWMVERLRRSGVRSISVVVDVTNYVMLELGQPMHAFDLDKLEGGIRVRLASTGEALTLLDEQTLEIKEDVLVIADHGRAVALAGIMGGLASSVTNSTKHIFLESAYFEPRHVAGDARRYGLHTDASHRFERGVDPFNQDRAIERASALLVEIAGGKPGPVIDVISDEHMPQRRPVSLRASRIERLLGVAVESDTVTDTLERLGLTVERTTDGWKVTPPGFRFDITIEADLIEEIARIEGYDKLATHRPLVNVHGTTRAESVIGVSRFKRVLVDRGYQEAITYSFVDAAMQSWLDDKRPIPLANPLSSDMTVMRTSLWPGLIQVMSHNTNRQQPDVRVFECGMVFSRQDGELRQEIHVAGLLTGNAVPAQWGIKRREADFFDVKSDVEALLNQAGAASVHEFTPGDHPALHPGQTAVVRREERIIGYVGLLHPRIARAVKHSGNVCLFEMDLAALQRGDLPRFAALSKFPGVRRDISIVIDEAVSSREVEDCVGQIGIDVLKNLELFDVYHGEGIDSGKKSLTLSLTFQASSRTLNDEEVESLVAKAVDALGTGLGAVLRG